MTQSEPTSNADGSTPLDTPDPAQQFGAAAASDADLADQVVADTDDEAEAEEEFAARSRGPVPTETGQVRDGE